jgi:hypothetical protein
MGILSYALLFAMFMNCVSGDCYLYILEIEIEIEISLLTKSGPQEGIYK